MGTGFIRLIRWAALFGMYLAFVHFLVALSLWAAPLNSRQWIGKRATDLNKPTLPGTVVQNPTAGRLTDYLRLELNSLFAAVREPSIWFCLTGILYLFAGHQLRPRDESDEHET